MNQNYFPKATFFLIYFTIQNATNLKTGHFWIKMSRGGVSKGKKKNQIFFEWTLRWMLSEKRRN